MLEAITHPDHVGLTADGTKVRWLDQTQLPQREVYKESPYLEDLYRAIQTLEVRGAPCIGIFAAYALYASSRVMDEIAPDEFLGQFKENAAYLASARPTAVNLETQIARMVKVAYAAPKKTDLILRALKAEAIAIHEEDIAMCEQIADYGLSLLKENDTVLTHCNAGPLATSRYGTGQGPFYLAKEKGFPLKAICTETRPLLQGARLTSYELSKAGVDVTLICDNMVSQVMQEGKVDAVMVGCDRVAKNGDTANKIGTSGIAILANFYNIPFYVLGPSSTLDFACATGADIPIEERDPEEIKEKFFAEPVALKEVACYNPAFDVTDHSLITAIITERGIARPPYTKSFQRMFPEAFESEAK